MKSAKIISLIAVACGIVPLSLRADDATTAPAAGASATAPATSPASMDSLTPAMDQDAWRFGVGIPLWAPQIDGNVTVAGRQKDVNISNSDLRDHLKSEFVMDAEAHKGKYSFYGDVGYLSLSASSTGPNGHVTSWAGLNFVYATAAMGYQLIKTESDHPFRLEGTAGVRYWYANTPVTFSDAGTGNPVFDGSKTWSFVDPVLGFRGSQYFTRKLHLDFLGDGGGFNINHNTDWTWSASAALAYDFTRWFTLSAGYKALALDQSENKAHGANGVDLIFNGVLVGLNFHW